MFKTRSYLAEVQLKSTAPLDPPAFSFTLPAIRSLERLLLHPNVTFLGVTSDFLANPARMLKMLM